MDKVVVITGASAGIGAALGVQAAAAGAKVADMNRLFEAALARFGRVDVWVNNAGRGISRSVSELTDADLDAMWTDNVKSALYGMQAVLPHFKARNAGQIVNVSSGLGRMPTVPFRSAYSAAKHALNALTASLRMELAVSHPGIGVSVVMPGPVATDFGNNALGGGVDSRTLPRAQTAEEVAAVMLEAIAERRADVYTAAYMQEEIERYYRDPVAMEHEMAARFRR
jgi:short-subunit dehydrogenase